MQVGGRSLRQHLQGPPPTHCWQEHPVEERAWQPAGLSAQHLWPMGIFLPSPWTVPVAKATSDGLSESPPDIIYHKKQFEKLG